MNDKKPTIFDVAKVAGVSAATVSRVINHPKIVKQATLNTVYKAIQATGYTISKPNSTSKPLVILNFMDNSNLFYSPLVDGVIASTESHGYSLLISHVPLKEQTIGDFIDMMYSIGAKGLISCDHLEPDQMVRLHDSFPLVQCCEYNNAPDIPYVGIDDYSATRTAVSHILSTGHTRIAFLNGPLLYRYARVRKKAFLNFLECSGIHVPSSWVVDLPKVNFNMAYSIAKQIFSSTSERPNAFFASSDTLAAAIICAAHDSNLKVPSDVVVVGFDNNSISIMTSPTITTINQPTFQIGYSASEILSEIIENPSSAPASMLLPTELIVRGSSTFNP